MINEEWVYISGEWEYLKSNKQNNLEFSTFDSFYDNFNKHSFLVPANGMSEKDILEFKIKLRNNAEIIYNKFKGKKNA